MLVTPLKMRPPLTYPFLKYQSSFPGTQVLFPVGQGGGSNLALQGRGEVEDLQTQQESLHMKVPKGPSRKSDLP